jgi:hypothetical protein
VSEEIRLLSPDEFFRVVAEIESEFKRGLVITYMTKDPKDYWYVRAQCEAQG